MQKVGFTWEGQKEEAKLQEGPDEHRTLGWAVSSRLGTACSELKWNPETDPLSSKGEPGKLAYS